MTISLVVSLIEVTILRFIGALVDTLRSTSPDEVLRTHGGEFLAMELLILIGRPLSDAPVVKMREDAFRIGCGGARRPAGAHRRDDNKGRGRKDRLEINFGA